MQVYSTKRVKVVWGTESLWDRTDEESGVEIYADNDAWRLVKGVDGEMARVLASSFPGRVIANVSMHTNANRNLIAKLVADAQTGIVTAPLLVVDLENATKFSAPIAFLQGLPAHGYASTPGFAAWTFVCPMLVPSAVPAFPTLFV